MQMQLSLSTPGRCLGADPGGDAVYSARGARHRASQGASQRALHRASTADRMNTRDNDITMLLRSVASGERDELDRLMTAIYEDMRRIASVHLREERVDHTIQPTALIHEVYIKLIDQRTTDWNDRLHFFAFASQVIRRILIDHARAKQTQKRGGGSLRVPLEPSSASVDAPDTDLIALDEALGELAQIDERQSRIVELRFFGGCTLEEIVTLLGVGRRTVDRDWTAAKAWLYLKLSGEDA